MIKTAPTKQILLIDSDPNILHLVPQLFADPGIIVHIAATATEGLQKVQHMHLNLVLLAPSLPDINRWRLLRRLRELTNAPILILIALQEMQDLSRYFAHGATDYFIKPFAPKLLVERVLATLREISQDLPPAPPQVMIDERLSVELDRRRVLLNQTEVKLTTFERRLFFYLLEHANKVCTFNEILANVWGPEYQGSTEYVHVYISRLRKRLEQNHRQPNYFLSEHGVGYWFRQG